jgi:hypothetical protein
LTIYKGEVRKIGIEVISQTNQNFIIETAEYIIKNTKDEAIGNGFATIEDHKIITLFTAESKGSYTCDFIYRIGPEILKAKVNINVV